MGSEITIKPGESISDGIDASLLEIGDYFLSLRTSRLYLRTEQGFICCATGCLTLVDSETPGYLVNVEIHYTIAKQ